MLLFLYICALVTSLGFAQNSQPSSETIPNACAIPLTESNSPGTISIFLEHEPNFVCEPYSCNSTNQKIIGYPWESNCYASIYAVCNTRYDHPGFPASWTWAWHTGSGYMCQIGLYQPEAIYGIQGVQPVNASYCSKNFEAMMAVNTRHRLYILQEFLNDPFLHLNNDICKVR